MINLFLSASVPLADSDPRFAETADVIAIREAVKGLVTVVAPQGRIVFGGHPAITPLIAFILKGMRAREKDNVTIYQSKFYSENFPPEVHDFVNVRFTEVQFGENSSAESVSFMRQKMITETKFDAAVFIGGMGGVFDEYELFIKSHPKAQIWPIASTGAAAAELFEKIGSPCPSLFRDELTYQTLFRKLVQKIPQDRKYRLN